MANSRVGAMMRQIGLPFASAFSSLHLVRAGSRYPSVFPLPVLAIASTSRPATASGQEAACTALGALKPGCAISSFINFFGKGAVSKLMQGRGESASWKVISFASRNAAAAGSSSSSSAGGSTRLLRFAGASSVTSRATRFVRFAGTYSVTSDSGNFTALPIWTNNNNNDNNKKWQSQKTQSNNQTGQLNAPSHDRAALKAGRTQRAEQHRRCRC
mmetsp:Transcript_28880/g.51643  ORF Transcript_28880/g.51643 Transcript_28880/m.51643 type:complete len:215 (-) Transcript_28880:231-875(-)